MELEYVDNYATGRMIHRVNGVEVNQFTLEQIAYWNDAVAAGRFKADTGNGYYSCRVW